MQVSNNIHHIFRWTEYKNKNSIFLQIELKEDKL